jgi:hypothetical protein
MCGYTTNSFSSPCFINFETWYRIIRRLKMKGTPEDKDIEHEMAIKDYENK